MTGGRLSVKSVTSVACLCACILYAILPAHADDVYASIRGSVIDSTGPVVTGVA